MVLNVANDHLPQGKDYLVPQVAATIGMLSLKYDIRMPQFHRLAIIMAQSRDLYETKARSRAKGPEGVSGRKCPKCSGAHYARCSVVACGFALCLDCQYSEHMEKAYADHR